MSNNPLYDPPAPLWWGGPPSRIPPYIGVVDKKRGVNTIEKILEKIFGNSSIYLIVKLMYMKKNICLFVKKITFGKVCLGWCTI